MADAAKQAQAEIIFEGFCQMLDQEKWHYKKDPEKLTIECGAQGDDLPMELNIHIDAERLLILLISHLPYKIQEDKRLDVAVAVSSVNNILVDGCFDYDIASGNLFFRMTNSFRDSMLGADLYKYLVYCSCQTIDEYNDKFLMIGKGMLSIEQFLTNI